MDIQDPRFAGQIGIEYKLFPLAVKHYMLFQREIAKRAASLCGIGGRILEIGCGNGLTTKEISLESHEPVTIIAIDADQGLLKQARDYVPDHCVEFVLADALEYLRAQPTASFTVVVTAYCMHNLPAEYRLACFREMGRVLKPGGALIQGDKIAHDDLAQHEAALKAQIEAFAIFTEHGKPELQAEWTQHYLDDDKIRLTQTEQRMLLQEAGCHTILQEARWDMDAIWMGLK
jgi:ubiquinone/menaquinone biosynthesis C-methylase UbiE